MTMTTDCYAACDKHLTSILISQFDFSGFLWSQLDFFLFLSSLLFLKWISWSQEILWADWSAQFVRALAQCQVFFGPKICPRISKISVKTHRNSTHLSRISHKTITEYSNISTVDWPLTPLAPVQPVYTKHTLEAMQKFVNKFSRSAIFLIRSIRYKHDLQCKSLFTTALCRAPNKHFLYADLLLWHGSTWTHDESENQEWCFYFTGRERGYLLV